MKFVTLIFMSAFFLSSTPLFADCSDFFGRYKAFTEGGQPIEGHKLILDGNYFRLTFGEKEIRGTLNNNLLQDPGTFKKGKLIHAFCDKGKLYIPYIAQRKLMDTDDTIRSKKWITLDLYNLNNEKSIFGYAIDSLLNFRLRSSLKGKAYPPEEVAFHQVLPGLEVLKPKKKSEEIPQPTAVPFFPESKAFITSIGSMNSFVSNAMHFPHCSALNDSDRHPTASVDRMELKGAIAGAQKTLFERKQKVSREAEIIEPQHPADRGTKKKVKRNNPPGSNENE